MQPIIVVFSILMPAIVGGIIVAFFARRMPASGRVAVWLLCFPAVSILVLPMDIPYDANRVFGGALFFGSVPFCLVYSIHARRNSSQKRAALAGLSGSILFTLAYLLMMPQMVYYLVREFTGRGFTQ
jgi:hypothetical protein